jgi:hypothetical protein
MSIIFEGDTTLRFGKKMPRTFIEKITLQSANRIEVAVSVFFETPVEQAEFDNFKNDLDNSGLEVYACLVKDYELQLIKDSSDSLDFNNFFVLDQNTQDLKLSINEFQIVDSEIYSSEGKRFIHFRNDFSFTYNPSEEDTETSQDLSVVSFSTFLNYIEADYSSKDIVFYKHQTSDLTHENIYKSDGSINRDPIVVYEESDGNYYYKTPLMATNRNYYKTDDYDHKDIISAVTQIVQNYQLQEADNLSFVMEQSKEDPRLLINLVETLNDFTDKSPVSDEGKLYEEVANYISIADTLIRNSVLLNKKQFNNSKIINNRGEADFTRSSTQANTNGIDYEDKDSRFFPVPIFYQKITPIVTFDYAENNMTYRTDSEEGTIEPQYFINLEDVTNIEDVFQLETQGFFLFDYEKALNYRSKISEILDPLGIMQIYGMDSLANYYEIESFKVSKFRITPGYADVTNYEFRRNPDGAFICTSDTIQADTNLLTQNETIQGRVKQKPKAGFFEVVFDYIKPTAANANQARNAITLNSKVVQRAFVARPDSLNPNYRMACYNYEDYEHLGEPLVDKRLEVELTIKDTTMDFYKTYIHTRMRYTLRQLKKYYDLAEEFCSYNSVDGKFNSFFTEGVKERFPNGFPWEEGPLYYRMFSSLISISRDLRTKIRSQRNRVLNIDGIKKQAILDSQNIGPDVGTFEELREYYQTVKDFYDNWFVETEGLDRDNKIYRNISGDLYELKNPEVLDIYEITKFLYADDIITAQGLDELATADFETDDTDTDRRTTAVVADLEASATKLASDLAALYNTPPEEIDD